MTAPGGGGNDVNLAALWVPIMPETSHMREGGRKAGEELMAGFREGVGSGGASLGQTLGSQLSSGFKSGMGNLELPGGLTNLTEGVMRGFEGMSSRSENARAALERLKQSEEQLVNSHNRVAVAQSRLNDLQQRGVTSGTQFLSASTGLISAKQREESALRQTSEAHEGYTQALSASRGGMMAFAAETGILAGAVAGAIPLLGSLIEGVIDFWKEAAEKGVEVSLEFTKHLLEIGESYHALGIQIQEFSTASGESLEGLETAAKRVFSSLDVAGNDTGRTMAMLSSRLNTTDEEALVPLTRHVEELHGRFQTLQTESVATAFAALDVKIEDADRALASWLQSARNAGVDTGALVNSLAQVGESLRPEITHMSAEQIGEWVAEMSKVEPNVNRTVMALTGAQKVFSQKGLDFAAGMQEAVKEFNSAATEADKEDLAEKLFGTRKWPAALTMAQEYVKILASPPPPAPPIDPFIKQTQDLENKWEEVKKKIGEALLPLGTDLLTHVSGGLDRLNNYVKTHSEQISQWVKNIGDSFIRLLPTLQQWAIDILEVLKPVTQGVELWGSDLLFEIGAVAKSMATSMDLIPGPLAHLIPGFDEAKKAAHGMADSTLDMSKKMAQAVDPTGRFFDGITNKIKDLHIDVPKLTTEFDNLSDSLGRKLGESADQGINGVHVPGAPSMNPFAAPGTPGAPPGGGEPAAPGGPPETPGGASGGAPGAPAGAMPSSAQTPAQQAVYRAMVEAGFPNSWSAISSIVSGEDASWNVTATNTTDSNALAGNPSRGIGQLTLSNYRAAGVDPYTNDAYQQGRAMMSYIKGRYGTPEAAWQHWQISRNYAEGGVVSGDPSDNQTGSGAAGLPDWWRKVLSSSIGGEGPPIPIDRSWMPNAGGQPMPPWITSKARRYDSGSYDPIPGQPGLGILRNQVIPQGEWDAASPGLKKLFLSAWATKAAEAEGVDPRQAVPALLAVTSRESGSPGVIGTGGPNIVNLWDTNARKGDPSIGFAQVTQGTANDPHNANLPGANLGDPVMNFRAALRHVKSGGKNIWDTPEARGQQIGYATGNLVTGGHGGVDDIPAYLTAGEFVMNKAATNKWLKVLRWMNAQAFDTGSTDPVTPGGTGSANAFAANPNSNDTQGVDQEILGATFIANKLGLRLTAGKSGHGTHDEDGGWHDKGAAGDFSNGVQTAEELAFAQYMLQNFSSEMAELIHDSPALPMLVKDGKLYPKSIYAKWLPGHRDHVHVAFAAGSSKRLEQLAIQTGQGAGATASAVAPGSAAFPAGMPAPGAGTPGSPGSPSAAPGGPAMGPPGVGAPAIGGPATTAGYGPYGMESYDQWYQANKSITGAQNRLNELNRQVGDKQRELDQVNADLTKLQAQPDLLKNDQQIQSKTAERDRLQEELNKIKNQDMPEASGAVDEATRKAWEDAQKMPGGQQEYKVPGVSEFTQLGGGLVKGVSQAFGFGDIFAKPPWEWGIVKLMSGLANWGLGTANAWAEEIGKGHTGMTGFQPVAGMEQSGSAGLEGVLKGFGLNVPMPQPQRVDRFGRVVGPAGPAANVGPGPAPGLPGSPGPGNGPVIQGDYMPINVSPNVNPSAILGPVQAQRNSDNANLHTFTGGMPPP